MGIDGTLAIVTDDAECHERWTLSRRTPVLVAAAILLWHAPVRADSAAEKSLREGRRHYDLREWNVAIDKFKTSYKLTPTREALFNLAQSFRQNGDCKDAVGTYKTYLRNYPGASNRAQVKELIEDLGDCPEPVVTPKESPVAAKPEHDEPKPEHPEPAPRIRSRPALRATSYVVGGFGLVGIAAGAKFALDGQTADDDLAAACMTACAPGVVRELSERGHAANRNAWIGIGAGAALVGTAVLLFVLSRDQFESSTVSIIPTSDGIHANVMVTF